ncbi:MAG: hypothetical protein KDC67_00190 [Ignavibacteriae bacterium]|nr:hypothetical protein [Ignavibacteriota bacterium]
MFEILESKTGGYSISWAKETCLRFIKKKNTIKILKYLGEKIEEKN